MYNPTISTTLSANAGSVLILNVFSRCGRKSAAFQIWRTCHGVTSAYRAINSILQCVASSGIRFVVRKNLVNDLFIDDCRASRARTFQQSVNTLSFKPISPLMHGLRCGPLCRGNVSACHSFTELQYDSCAHNLTVRQRRGSTPLNQSCVGLFGESKRFG